MLEEGIVVKQIKPIPWVSLTTFPKKPNCHMRVCMDPNYLNKVIMRQKHKYITVKETSDQFDEKMVHREATYTKFRNSRNLIISVVQLHIQSVLAKGIEHKSMVTFM